MRITFGEKELTVERVINNSMSGSDVESGHSFTERLMIEIVDSEMSVADAKNLFEANYTDTITCTSKANATEIFTGFTVDSIGVDKSIDDKGSRLTITMYK